MNIEYRSGSPVELRAEEETIKVSGYAAVFNEVTTIGQGFREVFMPGAFADAVGRDDVLFLINHDGLPLARTSSGTLKISEDKHGLKMEAELDTSDPDVQKIRSKMRRGDMDKMSFAFVAELEDQEWDGPDDELPLRTVKRAKLYDVSIVNRPAYNGTEIGLRHFQEFTNEKKQDHSAVKARMKMNLALSAK